MSRSARTTTVSVALATLCLGGICLTACGTEITGRAQAASGTGRTPESSAPESSAPESSAPESSAPESSAAPTSTGPTATDGTDLSACADLTCSVLITGTKRIPLHSTETDGMTVSGNGDYRITTNDGGGLYGSGSNGSGSVNDFGYEITVIGQDKAIVVISPN